MGSRRTSTIILKLLRALAAGSSFGPSVRRLRTASASDKPCDSEMISRILQARFARRQTWTVRSLLASDVQEPAI